MRHDKYILNEDHSIEAVDLTTWAVWFEKSDRRVRRSVYNDVNDNEIVVSTVFLGLDHSFSDGGPPILFETMVFGGKLDEEMERYATWDQAVAGHDRMLRKVIATEDQVTDWSLGASPD